MNLSTPQIAMTRQEIADLYQVSTKTLRTRLVKAGIKLPNGLVYPKDVKQVFKLLGNPRMPIN